MLRVSRLKTLESPESTTIIESVVIVAQLTFSLPLHLPRCLGWYHADLPSSVGQPFFRRSFFWALLQANSCVLQLRGFCFLAPPRLANLRSCPPINYQIKAAHQVRRIACDEQCHLNYIVNCAHVGKGLVSRREGSCNYYFRQLNSFVRLIRFEPRTLSKGAS